MLLGVPAAKMLRSYLLSRKTRPYTISADHYQYVTWNQGPSTASLEECLREVNDLSLRWIFPDTGWPIGGLDEYPADDAGAVNQK